MSLQSLSPKIRHNIHWMIVAQYIGAGVLAIGTLWLVKASVITVSLSIVSSWELVFVGLLAFTFCLAFFQKFRSRMLWEVMFECGVLLGVWYFFLLVLPLGWALGCAALLTLLHLLVPFVFLHNIFYLIGCVGVALNFADWVSPEVLLFGLVLFAVYDTVAGPEQSAIRVLASKVIPVGIVPGIVVPSSVRGLFAPLTEGVKEGVLLGAGDVIVPIALVSKAAIHGPVEGGIVLAGLVVAAALAGNNRAKHPHAIMPLLAAGCAVPFIILRVFSVV